MSNEATPSSSSSSSILTTNANLKKIFIVLFLDLLALGLCMPVLPTLISQHMNVNNSPSALVDLETAVAKNNVIASRASETSIGGARWYGLIVSAGSLAQLLIAPIVGQLSDKKLGRKRPISFFLFFISIYYVLLGMSSFDWVKSFNTPTINISLSIVFLAKLLGGLCAHVVLLSMTYISDISTSTTKAQNFGLYGVALGLAFIVGPATGGYLSAHIYFESPFFLAATLQLINALFVTFMIQDSWTPPTTHERGQLEWKSLLNPLRAFKVFTLPDIREKLLPIALSMLMLTICQQSFHSVWVLYAQQKFDWNTFHSGLFMTLTGVCSVIVQGYVIRVLIPVFGERNCASLGLLFGILLNVFVSLSTNGWMLYLIVPITSLEGLATPSLQSLVVKGIPTNNNSDAEGKTTDQQQDGPNIQGTVQGSITSLQVLSKVIASVVATQLFSIGSILGTPGISFLFGASVNLIALFVLRRSNHTVATEKDTLPVFANQAKSPND